MEERKETHKSQRPKGERLPRESIADRIREHRANQSRYKDRERREESREKERKEGVEREERGKEQAKTGNVV